jgi:hypothetical protein
MRSFRSFLLVWCVGAGTLFAQSKPARPLPLDPITSDEVVAAQQIAQSDAATLQLLGSNARFVSALSIAPKLTAQDSEPSGRYADLLYIRQDNTFGVRVLVDLGFSRVVDRVQVSASSVALGRADVAEALRIASDSPALRLLLGRRAGSFRVLSGPLSRETVNSNYVEGLRHAGEGPDDPCSTHRCVYLLFNSGGQTILQDQEILVDLNARETRVTATVPDEGHSDEDHSKGGHR